jgi:hypothetical protein
MVIQLDSDIPIPESRFRSQLRYPIRDMMHGQSFVVTPANIKSFRTYCYARANKFGIKVSTKVYPDGSVRVWRLA